MTFEGKASLVVLFMYLYTHPLLYIYVYMYVCMYLCIVHILAAERLIVLSNLV